jgi:hypothetical protein
MDTTLIQGIYEGTVDIDSLTEEQQEQVLRNYQMLAEHWAEDTTGKFGDLGKQILLLLEQASIELEDVDNDKWLQ